MTNSAPSARAFSQPARSFWRLAAKSPTVELSWSRPIFNGTRIVAAGSFAKLYPESRHGNGRKEAQKTQKPKTGRALNPWTLHSMVRAGAGSEMLPESDFVRGCGSGILRHRLPGQRGGLQAVKGPGQVFQMAFDGEPGQEIFAHHFARPLVHQQDQRGGDLFW